MWKKSDQIFQIEKKNLSQENENANFFKEIWSRSQKVESVTDFFKIRKCPQKSFNG